MATAATDRTLRLWDLERFEQVCCMPPESGQVCRVPLVCAGSMIDLAARLSGSRA